MRQYNFTINGNNYSVTVNSVQGNVADVTVTASYRVELANGGAPVQVAQAVSQPAPAVQQTVQAAAAETNAAPAVQQAVQAAPASANPAPAVQAPAPAAAPAQTSDASPAGGKGAKVVAPLPGNIVGIGVKVGDAVKAGQQVAVLEAMKMENSIESPADGTVTEILAAVGDAVAADAVIMVIG